MPVTPGRQLDESPEAADACEDFGPLSPAHERLDTLDELIACVDVDARIAVRDPGGFGHGRGRRAVGAGVIFYIPPAALARRANQMAKRLLAFLTSFAWLASLLYVQAASAGRPVRVYEVDLRGGQSPASLQEAMRQALVRATGRKESATDPTLASIVTDASTYVKAYTPGPHGQSQVIFDGVAVERAITAAGRSVWEKDRPFTLIVLYPALPRATEDSARAELEQAAIARGLPVTLVPLSPIDANGNELSRDALLQMAQRYGGDEVLVGRGDTGSANGQWQWTLHTAYSSESWSGSLVGGIDGTVDNLVPASGSSLAQTELPARVQVDGIAGLSDYAAVTRALEALPGVRKSNVAGASGGSVTFDLSVRGGADAIIRALGNSGHLTRAGSSAAPLVYQYRP